MDTHKSIVDNDRSISPFPPQYSDRKCSRQASITYASTCLAEQAEMAGWPPTILLLQ